MGLACKKVAAFASGDTSCQHFCGAVDVILEGAKAAGATVVASVLRMEGDASATPDDIEAFAGQVVRALLPCPPLPAHPPGEAICAETPFPAGFSCPAFP